MSARPVSVSLIMAALALSLCLPATAPAKYVSPPDVVKDPTLTSLIAKLKKAKSQEESKPVFEAIQKIQKEGGSPEQEFTMGYLHQYGIGTEASVPKALEAYQKSADAGNAAAKNNLGLLMLASGGDAAKGVGIIESLANSGDAAAQCTMGQLYVDGVPAAGMARDLGKARTWFERSAGRGDSDAAWSIAAMLVNKPNPTEEETKEAIPWLEKAVKAGNLPALVDYGMRLVKGLGMKSDVTRGVSMLQSALEKGSPQARMALAELYETGGGVKKDLKKAFDMYSAAADEGDGPSLNKLGFFYESGFGVEKDEAKAMSYYKKGADKNVGPCLYNLAVFNDDGRGGLKKDPEEAFRLHYKGAMTGFVPCQLALGTRYRDGKGVNTDPQAALAWYQRAMLNGNLLGALNVAAILENGNSGVVDNKTAASIYLKAAAGGNAQAMASLGAMIEDGRGVQGNFKQVHLLYSVGATAKVKGAEERLKQFKERLSAEQLKEAEAYTAANEDHPQAVLPSAEAAAAAAAQQQQSPQAAPAAPAAAPAAAAPEGAKPADTAKPASKPAAKPAAKSGSKNNR